MSSTLQVHDLVIKVEHKAAKLLCKTCYREFWVKAEECRDVRYCCFCMSAQVTRLD